MAEKRTFYSIQILRGVAALLVVLFHVGANLHEHSDFRFVPQFYFGNGGVDLFFLISGFVIYSTTLDQRSRPLAWAWFLSRRFTRIVPLYWLMTGVKLVSLVAIPAVMEQPELAGWPVIASFLFVPAWNSTHSSVAIIAAGWTLCFEMFFYYVFAVCLALRLRPLAVITPFFVALTFLSLWRTNAWGAPGTLIDPLLLEFVGGMWIGWLTVTQRLRLGTPSAVGLLTGGSVLLVASSFLAPNVAYGARVIVWCVPAAAIMIGFIALEDRVNFRAMRVPMLLGDASYAIYLTELSIRPIVSLLRHYHVGIAGEYAAFAGVVVVALCVGVAVYQFVEKPMLRTVRFALSGVKFGARAVVPHA